MYALIKDSKLKQFAFEASRKAKICCQKIHDVKSHILVKLKLEFKNSRSSTDKVNMYTQYTSKMFANFNIKNKQSHFQGILKVCSLYSECRENIANIFNRNYRMKKEAFQKILLMDKQTIYYKESTVQLTRMLAEIELSENAITECIYRVDELYKDKIINITSAAAQKLKYKVKFKLQKLEKTINDLNEFKNFMYLPIKINQAYVSAQELNQNHLENKQNIESIYSSICSSIIEDHENRKEFISKYGGILPENGYPELVTPVLNDSQIKKILNLSDNLIPFTFEQRATDNESILLYYEKEVNFLTKFIESESDEFKKKENILYSDIKNITRDILELESQQKINENTIKNFSQELALLKGRGGNEKYPKNLNEEIKKLKEKEAAFKSVFMENLKEVNEINVKLKHELSDSSVE